MKMTEVRRAVSCRHLRRLTPTLWRWQALDGAAGGAA